MSIILDKFTAETTNGEDDKAAFLDVVRIAFMLNQFRTMLAEKIRIYRMLVGSMSPEDQKRAEAQYAKFVADRWDGVPLMHDEAYRIVASLRDMRGVMFAANKQLWATSPSRRIASFVSRPRRRRLLFDGDVRGGEEPSHRTKQYARDGESQEREERVGSGEGRRSGTGDEEIAIATIGIDPVGILEDSDERLPAATTSDLCRVYHSTRGLGSRLVGLREEKNRRGGDPGWTARARARERENKKKEQTRGYTPHGSAPRSP